MITFNERIAIVKQHGGILPPFEAFYLVMMEAHVRRALDSFTQFYADAILERTMPALLTLSEALRQAGILARYFWPARNKEPHAMRGLALRASFGIEDDSPLHDLRLRNKIEHIDEYLDKYFLQDISGPVIPFAIDDYDLDKEDLDLGHVFMYCNPSSGQVIILNEVFNFVPLMNELRRLHQPIVHAAEISMLPRQSFAEKVS